MILLLSFSKIIVRQSPGSYSESALNSLTNLNRRTSIFYLLADSPIEEEVEMSFTLVDLGTGGLEFRASAWTWKPALEIIKSFNILDNTDIRRIGQSATGFSITQADAHAIGAKIREEVLPKLKPNKRIFSDLTITDTPDDGTFYRSHDEQWKNYSANYQWLEDFADFCLRSKGFQVF